MPGVPDALLRIVAAPWAVALTRILFRLEFRGTHHLPREGPGLLVANHQGFLDPYFLQLGTMRPIRYMMTSDYYDIRAAQLFFRVVGAIRVARGGPHRDTLKEALGVLDRGELVGIFPEGHISLDGRLGSVLPGAAFLAARSGAPLVPARISGSARVLTKGSRMLRQAQVRIRFGPPLRLARHETRSGAERIAAAWSAL